MKTENINNLYYWMNTSGDMLFNRKLSSYVKKYGPLYRYTGEEVRREWSVEQILDCEEKGFVKQTKENK